MRYAWSSSTGERFVKSLAAVIPLHSTDRTARATVAVPLQIQQQARE